MHTKRTAFPGIPLSILLALFIIAAPPSVFAADRTLDRVTVAGVDSLLQGELESLLLSRPGGVLNAGLVERDAASLTAFLRENGWWRARVETSVDTARAELTALTFTVDTGKPVLAGTVTTRMTEQVYGFDPPPLDGLAGERLTRTAFDRMVDDVIAQLSQEGYPDAAVEPSFEASGDRVDIELYIRPGARAVIDSIAVTGLTRTRDSVVRRELSSLIGAPAGRIAAGEADLRVARLDFVTVEKPAYVDFDDDGGGILVLTLGESGQGSFEGVLGYQPGEGGSDGALVGRIDLGLRNLFGTGRSGRVRWEDLGDGIEDLELGYREPWVAGMPYNVSFSFMQEERDVRGYIKTAFSGAIDRHIGSLNLQAGVRYEKVSADSLSSSRAVGVELGAVWNTLDNRLNPSRGIRYAGSWTYSSKAFRFGGRRKTGVERRELDFDHFLPTSRRQTAALLVRYRGIGIDPDRLTLSDRYWLGGASSIRGYRESMFPAVEALWSTVEYRFLTGADSRVFLFIDHGWLVDREKSGEVFMKKTASHTGYGFGIRLRSRAGMLGFDYGLARGDGPGDGKLHVRMSTEF